MSVFSGKKIAIIGGGAAGFFAANRAAELSKENQLSADIRIFEASSSYLKKVKISGGGRCNVTHHCFEPKVFCQNYPRGYRELLSPFLQFQALDTVKWFQARGVRLVAEEDGRMFPETNQSATIIECLMRQAEALGVVLVPNSPISEIVKTNDGRFDLHINGQSQYVADAVLVATGSSPAGYRFAESLGHSIAELAPSLFSFCIQDELIADLSGLSFSTAKLKLQVDGHKEIFKQDGPLLITHWGLSGPAALKLSAWAAREMKHSKYKAELTVNWLGHERIEQTFDFFSQIKDQNLKGQIGSVTPQHLTKRFWLNALRVLRISQDKRWADVSKVELQKLADCFFRTKLKVVDKNRYKDEFVECGGVELREIQFKTMESKICPGLYFAGEVLDIDGITGGFNFQNAWTTGWIAGSNMIG